MVFRSARQRKFVMAKLSQQKLVNLAKGFQVGGTAFFGKKDNAIRFARILDKKGFEVEGFRSGGPVVEKGLKRAEGGVPFGISIVGKKGKLFKR